MAPMELSDTEDDRRSVCRFQRALPLLNYVCSKPASAQSTLSLPLSPSLSLSLPLSLSPFFPAANVACTLTQVRLPLLFVSHGRFPLTRDATLRAVDPTDKGMSALSALAQPSPAQPNRSKKSRGPKFHFSWIPSTLVQTSLVSPSIVHPSCHAGLDARARSSRSGHS
ncbi:hypothetical protein BC939DRAFT_99408 [Gamsiella multidivaricata]|uniref:uncharacterized protein n=1 Tax=Gamsiella multidivaricata TaxID=101098 RepID=UPI002220BF77|nr:uncharacterized protein BC939DRAFT_99408 [Gamsiella multidivaricata]KAI7832247.1 hypothetical protein BC939DRAFT_99408 [Gamsiella multidivaricata]